MKKILILSTAALLAGSLTIGSAKAEESAGAGELLVPIINGKGEQIGNATLMQRNDKVVINVEAKGLTPGAHGIHFHAEGKCETPDFTSAGAHFNPHEKKHGFKNPEGFHSGDLPNIQVKADGTVNAKLQSEAVSLKPGKPNSLLKAGGTALIIHEKADDYVTDPSGNSGGRIACAVIK
ncbi:superoxide dismutase family protein [Paenibacillus soyae]|uniref:Superoxide dismutase [Cu-Zn] n=1 Tax=Paenibacillus soyae TaxID=2969249 RepID=A0A9X2SCX3_9BACL|nr:superoxide dismutase family protein [Paenibacillus soyae]MCR2806557.1 superoxide dismutase family protein [Paenibacillus soyae]